VNPNPACCQAGKTYPRLYQIADRFGEDWPPWLTEQLTPDIMIVAYENVVADDGVSPQNALPLSKRYYVEHVFFVMHFHAFISLILSLHILFSQLTALVIASDSVWPITSTAVVPLHSNLLL
jgi:hypothetical protein